MLKKPNRIINSIQILFLTCFFLLLFGCSVSPTLQNKSLDYLARTETQSDGNVRVSAVVLSPEETKTSFDFPLADKNVQPIWIEIENKEDIELNLMLLSLDSDYFSPSEVAWMFRSFEEKESYGQVNVKIANEKTKSLDEMIDMFMQRHIPVVVPPGTTVSGYVYTNLDPDTKVFTIDLFGRKRE